MRRHVRQRDVIERMRTDFMAVIAPCEHIRERHQRRAVGIGTCIPVVFAAEPAGDEVAGRGEAERVEHGHRMRQHVEKAVVERNAEDLPAALAAQVRLQFAHAHAAIAEPPEQHHLAAERIGRHAQAAQPVGRRRQRADLVIRQDRVARGGQQHERVAGTGSYAALRKIRKVLKSPISTKSAFAAHCSMIGSAFRYADEPL